MAKWVIDTDHSVAKFSVRHFMIANVVGLFSKISGTINYDPSDTGRLSAEAEIEVRSLTTGHQARDEHLLSPDYFDAEKYPKMIFKTTRVEPVRAKPLQGDSGPDPSWNNTARDPGGRNLRTGQKPLQRKSLHGFLRNGQDQSGRLRNDVKLRYGGRGFRRRQRN